jgi:hypothetical protein
VLRASTRAQSILDGCGGRSEPFTKPDISPVTQNVLPFNFNPRKSLSEVGRAETRMDGEGYVLCFV